MMIALLAGEGKKHGSIVGKWTIVINFIYAHPRNAVALGCFRRCGGDIVFHRASQHAIAATVHRSRSMTIP